MINARIDARTHAGTARLSRVLTTLGLFLGLALAVAILSAGTLSAQTEGREVAPESPVGGTVPGSSLGSSSDSEIWRAVREGAQGNVSIPDKQAGVLIQSEGDNWRAARNGPLTVYGAWVVLGFIGVVALFFLIRGRIRIPDGPSGRTIERFNGIERFVHWMTASSFVVMALTGLNLLYGRHTLLPLLGPEVFATVSQLGKYAHNYLALPFMLGVVMMIFLWLRDNIPSRHDLAWIAKGGGLLATGVHAPSKKFNAGQKMIFWSVVLSGLSLGLTGVALMFPFTVAYWDLTFSALNAVGFNLPTGITAMEEMQLSQLWHGVVGLVMMGIIVAHIYIGSLGMEGAFAAMGSGQVDENWAREHHNLWVAEVKGEPVPDANSGAAHPAE